MGFWWCVLWVAIVGVAVSMFLRSYLVEVSSFSRLVRWASRVLFQDLVSWFWTRCKQRPFWNRHLNDLEYFSLVWRRFFREANGVMVSKENKERLGVLVDLGVWAFFLVSVYFTLRKMNFRFRTWRWTNYKQTVQRYQSFLLGKWYKTQNQTLAPSTHPATTRIPSTT